MSLAARVGASAVCCAILCAQTPVGRFEQVARDYTYTKGPAWSRDGYLVFSDTPSNRILKWQPGHPVEVLRSDAQGPAGNAFDGEGRLFTCETRARRVVRMEKSGKIEVWADAWEGKRLNAPHDLAIDRSGHVYFTDPAFGAQSDSRELDFYGVFRIASRGALTLVARLAGRPNGIALAPNGRVLYVSDSDRHEIRALDLDRDGAVSGERVLVSGIKAVPGGLCVDQKGNLYVAAGGIAVYSPEGRPVRTLEIGERPSGCTFGNGDALIITAAGSLYQLLPEAREDR